jgi:hypothetical protein
MPSMPRPARCCFARAIPLFITALPVPVWMSTRGHCRCDGSSVKGLARDDTETCAPRGPHRSRPSEGFVRDDGRVATRNMLGVVTTRELLGHRGRELSSSGCARRAARRPLSKLGQQIFERGLEVASGSKSKSGEFGSGDNEFIPLADRRGDVRIAASGQDSWPRRSPNIRCRGASASARPRLRCGTLHVSVTRWFVRP